MNPVRGREGTQRFSASNGTNNIRGIRPPRPKVGAEKLVVLVIN